MRNVFAGSMVVASILFAGQTWGVGDSAPGAGRPAVRLADGDGTAGTRRPLIQLADGDGIPAVRRPQRADGDGIPAVRRPQRDTAVIHNEFV